jgi:mono/diheme cytochrome c family protein
MTGIAFTTGRAVATLLLAATASGCGSSRRSEPLVGAFVPQGEAQVRGEHVFFEFCHQCHPGGEAGLGPALNATILPDAAIRTQVREGLGAMPAFSESELPNRELDELIAYLSAVSAHGS